MFVLINNHALSLIFWEVYEIYLCFRKILKITYLPIFYWDIAN
jgi:hypothetical protein